MTTATGPDEERPEWREERLRYRVLRSVYDNAAASSARIVSGTELSAGVEAGSEELRRVLSFLEHDGYLITAGDWRRLCITEAGIEYIERLAGRRRSIRAPVLA